jgi:tetratricopeptide (TPR) repeat protein
MLVVALASAVTPPALALSAQDKAAARSAASAGADAFDAGQYDRAFEYFSRAEELVHAPPHLLYMARSLEKLGRLVEAHEAYLKITREQPASNAPKAFKDAYAQAQTEVSAVAARIAYVTVTVKGGANPSAAVITIDQLDMPPAVGDIPIPIDPGTHVFGAHTERGKSNDVTLTLRDGAKESVALTLVETRAPVAAAAPSAAPGEQPRPDEPSSPSRADRGSPAQSIAGYSALGVGIVATGVGTYFLVSALNSNQKGNEAYAACGGSSDKCDSAYIQGLDDDTKRSRNISIATYAVGLVGITTGVVLLVTNHGSTSASARHDREHEAGVHFGVGPGFVTAAGRF